MHKMSLPKKMRAFLAAYAECGNLTEAAKLAQCSRRQHYRWMENEKYQKLFSDAHEKACDALEKEARRRAVTGVTKPVFHKGEKVGVVREYSDTLLIFLMKGNQPEKYRENVRVSADVQQTVTHKAWTPPEELMVQAAADFNRFMGSRFNGKHETNGHADRN